MQFSNAMLEVGLACPRVAICYVAVANSSDVLQWHGQVACGAMKYTSMVASISILHGNLCSHPSCICLQ